MPYCSYCEKETDGHCDYTITFMTQLPWRGKEEVGMKAEIEHFDKAGKPFTREDIIKQQQESSQRLTGVLIRAVFDKEVYD